MKKVVFLTMDSLENFECYDHLLIRPLEILGWQVEEISWRRKNVNWNNNDAVIVRSTWDYQSDSQKFLKVLEDISKSTAVLFNDFQTLKWNMNKIYLKDLKDRGVHIVPTMWEKEFIVEKLISYFSLLGTEDIIIKPNISANADNTLLLNRNNINKYISEISDVFKDRNFMVQPFLKNIILEGEYSLFYFNGMYSHTILKVPEQNDFRVQEEHGGKIKLVQSDSQKQNICENIIKKLSVVPLYARIDLVRTNKNEFVLMELELIEPSLYFHMDKDSPKKFAKAFDTRMMDN
jgi:glutathione synthase/RimK-type ligase-like ATP-grasp enzyme